MSELYMQMGTGRRVRKVNVSFVYGLDEIKTIILSRQLDDKEYEFITSRASVIEDLKSEFHEIGIIEPNIMENMPDDFDEKALGNAKKLFPEFKNDS